MKNKNSQEKLINKAIEYHLKGNIQAASKYYRQLIGQGLNNHIIFSNYGALLKDLGKYEEAKTLYLKAIKLKPDFSVAYANLGKLYSPEI